MQENKNKRIGRVIPFERDGAFFLSADPNGWTERSAGSDQLLSQAQRRDPRM